MAEDVEARRERPLGASTPADKLIELRNRLNKAVEERDAARLPEGWPSGLRANADRAFEEYMEALVEEWEKRDGNVRRDGDKRQADSIAPADGGVSTRPSL